MNVILREQAAAQRGAPPPPAATSTQTTEPAMSQHLAAGGGFKPASGRGRRSRGSPYPQTGKGRGSSAKGRLAPGPVGDAPVNVPPAVHEVHDLATPPDREGSAPASLDRAAKASFKLPLGRAARIQRARMRLVPLNGCRIWKKQLPPQDAVP